MSRYQVRLAKQTGGKAGKGNNKTSTYQVFDADTNCVRHSVRFSVDSMVSMMRARQKAHEIAERMNRETLREATND